MKRKQFLKGMTQLAQEGAVQIYENLGSMESYIVGAVGQLQFEVLEYRLKHEYGVDLEMNRLPYTVARWIQTNGHDYKELKNIDSAMIVKDHKQRVVLLIANEWQTTEPGIHILHHTGPVENRRRVEKRLVACDKPFRILSLQFVVFSEWF